MDRTPALDGILDDLEQYILYRKDEGDRFEEVKPETMRALGSSSIDKPSPAPPAPGDTDGSARDHVPASDPARLLDDVAARVAKCTLCSLHTTRTNTVPGQGPGTPEIMFIGEGPGAEEDKQGIPFVGRAGQLLTKMIEAMGYRRSEVFIGNIVKCRPPGNRAPLPEEMEACFPYLKRQIAILKPRVLLALGATASQALLQTTTPISKLRGRWHLYEGIDLMPTFHPAYLLRNAGKKREAWEDLKEVLARLGREPPPILK